VRTAVRDILLGGTPSFRQRLNNILLADGATVADYQPRNYTSTLNASAWLNSIGAAPSLAQASGAAQPIILPFSGQKYAWIGSANNNLFSTPNAAENQIVGDIALVAYVAPNAAVPATNQFLMGKATPSASRLYEFYLTSAGNLRCVFNGAANLDSTVGAGFSNGVAQYVATTRSAASGDVKFFNSPDGITFSQLGTTVSGASGAINSSSQLATVGNSNDQNAGFIGKIYKAQLFNGIPPILGGSGSAIPTQQFSASDWPETTTNGATAVSSTTGETWKLTNTGTKLAQIVASPQLLFDGAAFYMQMATTLVQPVTVYAVINQITWTILHALFDGNSLATGELVQTTATPTLDISAGTPVAPNANLALNTYGVVTAIFNGASSSLQINSTVATTGNAGAGNMGGYTIGANAAGLLFGNLQAKELILRNVSDSAGTQANIRALLKSLYSTP
jgi:hypothetical protein